MSSRLIFKLGSCQISPVANKIANFRNIRKKVEEAVEKGVQVMLLPEQFSMPLIKEYFDTFAENFKDVGNRPNYDFLSDLAKEKKLTLIGGSISEFDDHGNMYSTALVFD